MSITVGKESQAVVDYAELQVAAPKLQRKLGDQLNANDFEGAITTTLELKVLFTHLYWHLSELPHMAIHYARLAEAQATDRKQPQS